MLDIFALLILLVLFAAMLLVIAILGALPGRIARNRRHPNADAVGVAGWSSLLMPLPLWPLAMVWAYMRPSPKTHAEELSGGAVE